jgi:rare lipoprotein A
MLWLNGLILILVSCTLSSCKAPPAPPQTTTHAHYVRESVWLANGKYFYPQEMTQLDQTGLASVARPDHPALTTDGEPYDPTALAAAHQTLQLPAIVSVTNLANGRQIEVRVNDRGPLDPGRVIELTPRAAELLQISANTATQVHITLDSDLTEQLARQLHGGTLQLALNTAPVADVSAQSLAPPTGIGQSGRGLAPQSTAPTAATQDQAAQVPDRLPERITQTVPNPGRIFIRVDDFARADYAMREAAILAPYGSVLHQSQGGEERFLVRGGPYPSVAAADAALNSALRLGLRGARIVVE